MANFVEQAVLQLQDKTSAPASKINTELNKLFNTMNKLQKAASKFKINPISTATINSYGRLSKQIDALAKSSSKLTGLRNLGPSAQQANRANNMARAMSALAQANRGMPRNGLKITLPNIPQNRIDKINQLTAALRNYARVAKSLPQTPNISPRVSGRGMSRGGGNFGGGGGGGIIGMGGGSGGRWTLTDTMIHGFALELQNAVRRAVVNGIKEGYTAQDIADTRLSDLNMTPQQKGSANTFANDLIKQFPILSKGNALQLYSETVPVAKGNAEGAKLLTVELARYVRTMVTRGENPKNAISSANSIAKAGEQAGILMDNDGNFDIKNAKKFFDTVNKGFLLLGREGNAGFVQDLIRNLQGAKYSINDEGLITAMLLGEDMGASRTGTGINQAVRQLSGERIQKKQLNRLIEMGLLDPSAVPAGMVGDKSVMELVGGSATDEEGLRTNFFKWINNTLIPKMTEQGFDAKNPIHAAKFAGAISSDRTSVNMIAAAIVRSMDIRKTLGYGETLDVSDEKFDQTAAGSGTLAFQEFTAQTETLLGSIANSLEGTFIPALKSAAGWMQSMSSFFEGKQFSGAGVAAAAVGAGGLLYGGAKLGGAGMRSILGGALSMNASTVYLNAANVVGNGMGGAASNAANAATSAGATGWLGTFAKVAAVAAATYAVAQVARPYVEEAANKVGGENAVTAVKLVNPESLASISSTAFKVIFDKYNVKEADPSVTQLATQISELTAKIGMAKEKEAFPGANEMMIVSLENERRLLEEKLATVGTTLDLSFATGGNLLRDGATNLQTTFSTGAAELDRVGPTINAAAQTFGPTAGAGILGVASAFGSQAGAAFLQAAGKVSVDVNVNSENAASTGRTPPLN